MFETPLSSDHAKPLTTPESDHAECSGPMQVGDEIYWKPASSGVDYPAVPFPSRRIFAVAGEEKLHTLVKRHHERLLLTHQAAPNKLPKVLGIVGYSGVGKTTLLTALLPMLQLRGLRTAVIKNTHPDFEIDYPGKDSQVLRTAGAAQVLLASSGRWALIAEQQAPRELTLDYWLSRLPPGEQDLVLVEGFRTAARKYIDRFWVNHCFVAMIHGLWLSLLPTSHRLCHATYPVTI